MRRPRLTLAAAVVLWATAAGVSGAPRAFGETVTLTDGTTRTIAVTFRDSAVLRGVENGKPVELAAAKVRKVAPDADLKAAMAAKIAALEGAAPETLCWVAAWALDNGFAPQAGLLYRRVLSADPENAAAHRGLGHHQADGKWWTSETEWRASRGEVPFRFGQFIAKAELEVPGAYQQLDDGDWVSAMEASDLEAGKPLIGPDGSGVRLPNGPREKGWIAVITRHYRIQTSLSGKRLERYATALEAAWRYFDGYYPFAPKRILQARGFASPKVMQEWYLANRKFPMAANTNGFYCGFSGELLFAFYDDDETTEEVIVHEAAHQFEGMGRSWLPVGNWYREGLPCFHSHFTKTAKKTDGVLRDEFSFGALNPKHNYNLVFMAKHSWAGTVWTVDEVLRGEGKRNDDNKIDPDIYHHAWAFVYFLKTCEDPPIKPAFEKWEAAVWADESLKPGDGERLLREHLAEWWPKLDEHFKAYVAVLAKNIPKGKYK